MAAFRELLLRVASLLTFLVTITHFMGSAQGSLLAVPPIFDEEITDAFLPNERESIDDCHLRYYKYGQSTAELPAFGSPAYLREFAHMAAIGWTQPDGTIVWDCGGSIIWENYVLTAGHCTANDENAQPDVVRLGDINLYNDTDDQYAQQLRIVEIIRHPQHRFSSRYHDLALLRLEKNIDLHDTVAPGCLWNDEEIPFPSMEATGWGATGFGLQKTPILLKVSLSVVKKEECDTQYQAGDRGLRQGLQSYHLCAGDIKMDTCPGDSGGPLQIKLLHNAKMTPFIVAVTSFGSVCGQSVPGVYMKVSSYIPWIRSELAKRQEKIDESSFKPYACALRYAHLREYEDDVITDKSDGVESIDSSNSHMNILDSTQTVSIHWPEDRQGPDNCHGVIIDEETVVTVARCAALERRRASHVVHGGIRNNVVQVYRHPMYRSESYYNEIAILKVKDRFKFSEEFVPACIWSAVDLPDPRFYVTGQGRLDLNTFNTQPITELEPQIVQLSPRADIQFGGNCTVPEEYLPGLSSGLTSEHMCFGNKPFLVPESCQLQIGAPLRRDVWRLDRFFEHIYGLNLLGKDCGFGRSAVATRLAHHVEWLNTVLLPNYRDNSDAVSFFNADLAENDHCSAIDGIEGLCVSVQKCPKVAYDMQVNRNVRFCSSQSIVCCPYHNVKNQTSDAARELDDCESRYKMFHRFADSTDVKFKIDQFYHAVYIGWREAGITQWHCGGTLITRKLVVSSAHCIVGRGLPPDVINIAEGNPEATWSEPVEAMVEAFAIHPGFNPTTMQHNIALAALERNIVPTALKYPICLWQNETHTPFLLHRMIMEEQEAGFVKSYPKYNSDCQEYFKEPGARSLDATEFCTDSDGDDVTSITGAPIVWFHRNAADNSTMQYLVGLVSFENDADQLGVNTRISSYVGWIKSLL